jgi:hypothetical protein
MILGPNHQFMLQKWTRAIVAARPRRALDIFQDDRRFARYIEKMHGALTQEFGVGATESDAGAFTASYVLNMLRNPRGSIVAMVDEPVDRFLAAANEVAAAFEQGSTNNFAALWNSFLEAMRAMQAAPNNNWSLALMTRGQREE